MHRAGVLGDEEEYVVALALRVGVVVLVGGCDPSETRAAVERSLWLEAVLLRHWCRPTNHVGSGGDD